MARRRYRFRDDLDVPVLVFETETDVGPLLAYATARQPDTDHLRIWEVAGTAHADAHLVGPNFTFCSRPINDGPQHWVAKAAMEALLGWVDGGAAPSPGEPIGTEEPESTAIVRDERGLAIGGIRTPSVDVPVSALSGESPGAGDPVPALRELDPVRRRHPGGALPHHRRLPRAVRRRPRRRGRRRFRTRSDRDAYAAEARAISLSR